MAMHIRDKQAARKLTAAAQLAAVVFVGTAGAAAAGIFALGEFRAPQAPADPVVPELTDPAQAAADPEPRFEQVDNLTIRENLSLLGNKPEPPDESELAADPEPDEPETDDSREIRFVGSVRSRGQTAAFLSIGGVTKLLRPGQAYEGIELVAVEDDFVRLSINGGDEEAIDRAERTGSAVSVVVGGAPDAPKTVAGNAALEPDSGFEGDMSREERRAQLIERARADRSRWQRDRGEERPDRN